LINPINVPIKAAMAYIKTTLPSYCQYNISFVVTYSENIAMAVNERSIPPEIITIMVPRAKIPRTVLPRRVSNRLATEKKVGFMTPMINDNPTITRATMNSVFLRRLFIIKISPKGR